MCTLHTLANTCRGQGGTPPTQPHVCVPNQAPPSCQPCQVDLIPGEGRCTNPGIPAQRAWGARTPQVTNTSLPRAAYCSSAWITSLQLLYTGRKKHQLSQRAGCAAWSASPSPHAACPMLDVLNLTSLRKPTRCWAPHRRGRCLKRQPVPETSGSTASTSHSSSSPCPSTRVNPVSSHARRQRGKCTDELGIWLPARSLQGHTQPGGMNPKPPASRTPQPPQPASQKAASHPAEGRKGGGRFGSSSVAVPMSSFWWDSRGFLFTPSSSEAHEHFQQR